jgi:hypothetical protein
MAEGVGTIIAATFRSYQKTDSLLKVMPSTFSPSYLQVIDAFLVFYLLVGITQFLYCCIVGTFPFNSFLAGFISCVGMFVLTGSLRFVPS